MSVKWTLAVLGAVGAAFVALPAQASPVEVSIPTLFNSGVDASGVPLPDRSTAESHYVLTYLPPDPVTVQRTSVPGGSTTNIVVYRADGPNGLPDGSWTGDDSISAWIGPNNDPASPAVNPVGTYYYTTTFDLTGFDPSTARIYGAWSADDAGAEIILNGQHMRYVTDLTYGPQNFGQQSTFNFYSAAPVQYNLPITDGFVGGLNTLSFRVDNLEGATGFRVEFQSYVQSIPEPSSVLLLSLPIGLGMIAIGRRPRTMRMGAVS